MIIIQNLTFVQDKKILKKVKSMKQVYKMIVLDLDGTLTNSKKVITPKTKEALIQAQKKGVRIVLASGRPTYGIKSLAEELCLNQHHGYIP